MNNYISITNKKTFLVFFDMLIYHNCQYTHDGSMYVCPKNGNVVTINKNPKQMLASIYHQHTDPSWDIVYRYHFPRLGHEEFSQDLEYHEANTPNKNHLDCTTVLQTSIINTNHNFPI